MKVRPFRRPAHFALETVEFKHDWVFHSAIAWRNLLSREPSRRRGALREISYRLPFRPFFRFAYMYLLRRGFLDGLAGFRYCCLLAVYEFMIEMKMSELRRELPINDE